MALASALLATLVAALASAAAPASSTAGASSFVERGRRAYAAGDYEATLGEMMLAVMEDPKSPEVREYLRLAAEGLLAQRRRAQARRTDALLEAYDSAIRLSREATLRWNEWIFQARRAARKGRPALAYDGFSRVLGENPLHEDARDGLREAKLGLARALAEGTLRLKKDELVYNAVLAYDGKRNQEALLRFREALAQPGRRAELTDLQIQSYLARLSPPDPSMAPGWLGQRSAAAPPRRMEPVRQPRSARPDRVAVRKPLPQPGQWAHAQGMAKRGEGLLADAVELLSQAVAEAPSNESYRGDLERVQAERERLRESRGAEAQRLYTIGIVLYGQGQVVEAVAQWGKAVELDPEHRYAQRALQHARQELEAERK
ncbi:MAG: hypothetical protein HY554_03030 [Elusimicrobia bacterium]|nr:hypothetical protein [Elusimicrobiota bacterium]